LQNALPVKTLVKQYTSGRLLPRGRIFTLFNDRHREQMITIFESLLYAEDWETFLRTACYARDRVNEGQFVYALSVAVLHRDDTRGMVLPPAYETYPHLFVNSNVIHAAYRAKMRQQPAVVRMNFTGRTTHPELLTALTVSGWYTPPTFRTSADSTSLYWPTPQFVWHLDTLMLFA
jgi:hypothetical protein